MPLRLLCPLVALALCSVGCQTAPPAEAGKGVYWGKVELVPREGVTPLKTSSTKGYVATYGGGGAAGGAQAQGVRYGAPDFAIVHYDGAPSPGGELTVDVVGPGQGGLAFQPAEACVGVGGRLRLRNADAFAHTVSCPETGHVKQLGPGETWDLGLESPGVVRLALVDAPDVRGTALVAPGPFVRTEADGSYRLALPPGQGTLTAWHPRMPAAGMAVQVQGGVVQQLDIELRVENVQTLDPIRAE